LLAAAKFVPFRAIFAGQGATIGLGAGGLFITTNPLRRRPLRAALLEQFLILTRSDQIVIIRSTRERRSVAVIDRIKPKPIAPSPDDHAIVGIVV
jgi:hypothetical protein